MVQLDELAAEPAAAAPGVSNATPYGRPEKLSTAELLAEVTRLRALRAEVEAREKRGAARGPLSDVDEEQAADEARENEDGNAWCGAATPALSRHVGASHARAQAVARRRDAAARAGGGDAGHAEVHQRRRVQGARGGRRPKRYSALTPAPVPSR